VLSFLKGSSDDTVMFSIYFDFSRFFFFVGRKARKAWKSFGFAGGGLTLVIHLPD